MGITLKNYNIIKEIGSGGMGVIYRAQHKTRGEIVALKVIHSYLTYKKTVRVRFLEDAQSFVRLNHSNILSPLSCFEEEGQIIIAAPFLEGKTLCEILREQNSVGDKQAIEWLSRILQGLSYAHEQGIVHRDLKPSNVFITDEDDVKILDFGLGKQLGGGVRMTESGEVLGSPAYLPPETYTIENKVKVRDLGPKGDIFALGVIAYRMLSGRFPFNMTKEMSSSEIFTLLAVRYNAREPIAVLSDFNPNLSAALVSLVMQCLEQDPGKRPESAEEISRRLDCLKSSEHQPDILRSIPLPDAIHQEAALSMTGEDTFFTLLPPNGIPRNKATGTRQNQQGLLETARYTGQVSLTGEESYFQLANNFSVPAKNDMDNAESKSDTENGSSKTVEKRRWLRRR
jgi:serine/threonine protein kinase